MGYELAARAARLEAERDAAVADERARCLAWVRKADNDTATCEWIAEMIASGDRVDAAKEPK